MAGNNSGKMAQSYFDSAPNPELNSLEASLNGLLSELIMADVGKFIDNYLQHTLNIAPYDPQKAHEYYMRTRKLKGRNKGSHSIDNPGAHRTYDGKTLPKLGTRMEEDTTPNVSPQGAKLVSYDGHGLGRAVYADGHVYDARTGWQSKTPIQKGSRAQRAAQAHQRINRARALINKINDPKRKAQLLQRLKVAEDKLHRIYGSKNGYSAAPKNHTPRHKHSSVPKVHTRISRVAPASKTTTSKRMI